MSHSDRQAKKTLLSSLSAKERLLLGLVGVLALGFYAFAFVSGVKSDPPTSASKAGRYIVDTWTGSSTSEQLRTTIWTRVDFFADSTARVYHAEATDAGWPTTVETGRWSVSDDKYWNTGEHFLKIDLRWDRRDANVGLARYFPVSSFAIRSDGTIRAYGTSGDDYTTLRRGDHFPR